MTYNKVFEVFQDYLSEDKDTEVLNTSRGYLVVMWETSDGDWVTSRLAEAPEDLRDMLQERYVDFHSFQFSTEHERDPDKRNGKRSSVWGRSLLPGAERRPL